MNYVNIGWCTKDSSDKVWGSICLSHSGSSYGINTYVTFWGRRGAKLQTKIVEGTNWYIYQMFRKKQDKGYQEVDKRRLDEVYPDFERDLRKTALIAKLKL